MQILHWKKLERSSGLHLLEEALRLKVEKVSPGSLVGYIVTGLVRFDCIPLTRMPQSVPEQCDLAVIEWDRRSHKLFGLLYLVRFPRKKLVEFLGRSHYDAKLIENKVGKVILIRL